MAPDEISRLAGLKKNLERRDLIYQVIRRFFHRLGFLEVETPLRVPAVAPELYIEPVGSENWYLSTSPELYMKRLLASGYDKLFQISHSFRKGERGAWHNPEFSMLEWYRAPGDYEAMMRDTENLILEIALELNAGIRIGYLGEEIDLNPPWPRRYIREEFKTFAGWDPVAEHDPLRFDLDLCDKVIPSFAKNRPTIIKDYPAEMASLSRLKPDGQIAERAEVFIGGLEIANAYSELTSPVEQEKRFQADILRIEKEYGRKAKMPEHFLEALEYLPECGGIALGIDRLVMLLCNARTIDEVMAFTADTA